MAVILGASESRGESKFIYVIPAYAFAIISLAGMDLPLHTMEAGKLALYVNFVAGGWFATFYYARFLERASECLVSQIDKWSTVMSLDPLWFSRSLRGTGEYSEAISSRLLRDTRTAFFGVTYFLASAIGFLASQKLRALLDGDRVALLGVALVVLLMALWVSSLLQLRKHLFLIAGHLYYFHALPNAESVEELKEVQTHLTNQEWSKAEFILDRIMSDAAVHEDVMLTRTDRRGWVDRLLLTKGVGKDRFIGESAHAFVLLLKAYQSEDSKQIRENVLISLRTLPGYLAGNHVLASLRGSGPPAEASVHVEWIKTLAYFHLDTDEFIDMIRPNFEEIRSGKPSGPVAEVVRTLTERGDVGFLVSRLANDYDGYLYVMEAAAKHPTPNQQALAEFLKTKPCQKTFSAIAWSLHESRKSVPDNIVSAFVEAVRNVGREKVVVEAATAAAENLGYLQNDGVTPLLGDLLMGETRSQVKQGILESLARRTDVDGLAEPVKNRLEQIRKDSSERDRVRKLATNLEKRIDDLSASSIAGHHVYVVDS